jgi:ethanolamine utilization protein EutM
MESRSLGLIETWGLVPAIEAADVGAKAANVTLLGYQVVPVGRIVVTFVGDVAAVTAAVSAGAAAAQKLGQVLAVHVIPRPDAQIHVGPPTTPPPTPEEKAEGEEPEPSTPVEEPAFEEGPSEAMPSVGNKAVEEPPEPSPVPEEKMTKKASKSPSRPRKAAQRRRRSPQDELHDAETTNVYDHSLGRKSPLPPFKKGG